MTRSDDYCIVITAVESMSDARMVAHALVEKALAACVQLSEIESHYAWRGEITHASEVRLMIYTCSDRYEDLELELTRLHSSIGKFECPEIVQIPIVEGVNEYLSWIADVSRAR
jgi:periplasmic divalent cation tolerance protein